VRRIYKDEEAEPKEVSVAYIEQLYHEHNLVYDDIENDNVRELIKSLTKNRKEDSLIDANLSKESL